MSARTPEECDRLFAEYVNAGNLDGVVGLYEPGGTLVQQDGEVATGPAAIRAALAGLLGMKAQLTMKVTRVVRAGDDLAVLYNDWNMTAIGPDGGAVSLTGKALEIVRRHSDGLWRFAVDDPFARG